MRIASIKVLGLVSSVIILLTFLTSCISSKPIFVKKYEVIGHIVNEDTCYIKKNKVYDETSFVCTKKNGRDTCVVKEVIVYSYGKYGYYTYKKYKENKFLRVNDE